MSSLPIDYRPEEFDQFIGSKASVKTLLSKVEKEDPPHSYLIIGPSGCGKTTLGRIAATYLINNPQIEGNMNFTELDAASFGLKDTVRNIRKNMTLAPIGGDEGRVWLMDECHQLTKDAQEALLKALEDPPDHAFFILCTTEPGKLKTTLKRRCVTIEVFPVEDEELEDYLNTVVQGEGKENRIKRNIIEMIVDNSLGSPGIALQQLESIIDLEPKDMTKVIKNYENIQTQSIDLCRALIKKEKWKSILKILNGGLLDNTNIESVRIAVLRYSVKALLGGDEAQAYIVADSFSKPFYNDPRERLVLACYEVLFE